MLIDSTESMGWPHGVVVSHPVPTRTPHTTTLYSDGHIKPLTCQSPLRSPCAAMTSDGRTISAELRREEVVFGIISTDRMRFARRSKMLCYKPAGTWGKTLLTRGSKVAESSLAYGCHRCSDIRAAVQYRVFKLQNDYKKKMYIDS